MRYRRLSHLNPTCEDPEQSIRIVNKVIVLEGKLALPIISEAGMSFSVPSCVRTCTDSNMDRFDPETLRPVAVPVIQRMRPEYFLTSPRNTRS